jgi:uncharacterized protein (DUF362 family)
MLKFCNHYKDLRKLSLLDDIWEGFPQVRGKKVFVKPNLVVPATVGEEASCTKVEIIQLVIEKLKEEGCSNIVIGDCGFKDQWELTISSTGYDILPKKYGIKLIGLMLGENFHKFTLKRSDKYLSLFGAKFSDYMLECDLVINVPKLKVHKMALVTVTTKNMMGTMIQKGNMHPKGSVEILHKRLADLYFLTENMVKFCLVDGIIGSEYSEHCGIPKIANVLISSSSMYEADCIASQVMGISPEDVPYLNYIKKRLPTLTFSKIPNNFVVPFEKPLRWR